MITCSQKRHRGLFSRGAPELCACTFAAGWFFYLGYGPTLNPTHLNWMFRGDWSAYLWGFCFFRNSEWAFPLGATPELLWPFGTSVGFTDANPWAAVLFKVLSPLLPADFQFSGMWYLTCFVLQALFGTRIAKTFTGDRVQQALGGCLFAVTPLLPSRHAHIALCGFFFVAAALYLHLKPVRTRAQLKPLALWTLALLVWAAGTHGYLSVMTLLLVLALCVRLAYVEKLLSSWEMGVAAALAVLATLGTYYAFGYIGWKTTDLTAEGFGRFSGDLSALINPQGWSRLLPSFRPRRGEGFSYLGVGVLLLLVLALARAFHEPRRAASALRKQWPLILAVLAMWIYSLSSKVALFGQELLNLSEWYAHLGMLTGIFRGSGRFSWPLNLALTAAGIAAAATLPNRVLGRGVLVIAVALQVAELKPKRISFHDVPTARLAHPAWQSLSTHYRHLQIVPPHLLWVCPYDANLVNRLSYEAYRHKLTFNSGNVTRKEPGMEALCERHLGPETALDTQTVYIVDPGYLSDFANRGAVCGSIDGLLGCVVEASPTPLRDALRAQRVM